MKNAAKLLEQEAKRRGFAEDVVADAKVRCVMQKWGS